MNASAFSWAMALRAMNASVCAYQIRAAGVLPSENVQILRSVPGGDGTFFYDLVPSYQNPVGFIPPGKENTPVFTATGADLTDAALIGLTLDGYAMLAFRGTLAPNLTRDELLGEKAKAG